MFTNRRRGGSASNYGLILLAYQMIAHNDKIPPVTLGAIVFQVAVFLGFVPYLDASNIYQMCVQPSRIVRYHEWWRLIAPTFMHGDDMHLYFNMVSLLWKGRRLERRMGSKRFLLTLLVFSVLTSLTMVGMSLAIEEYGGLRTWQLMQQCAVGFSGVLFALKVLCNHYFPHEDERLLGWLPVPSRYACWAELVLIQLISPNASFIGHLAGILVGLTYTMGPLKHCMDILASTLQMNDGPQEAHYERPPTASTNRSRNWGSGMWGGGSAGAAGDQRNAYDEGRRQHYGWDPNLARDYTAGLSEEEQVRQAMEDSMRSRNRYDARSYRPPYPSAPPLYPDLPD